MPAPSGRFTLVYGSLIYQLLGDSAETGFAHDWAVGLGIDQATQWKARAAQEPYAICGTMRRLRQRPLRLLKRCHSEL